MDPPPAPRRPDLDLPNTPPAESPSSRRHQRDIEAREGNGTPVMMPAGSLPAGGLCRQPFSHSLAATPCYPQLYRNSLDNTPLNIKALEQARLQHVCSPNNSRRFDPPPYFASSTPRTILIPPHAHARASRDYDARHCSPHHPVGSCCSQSYLAQQCSSGGPGQDEACPLLSSNRSRPLYRSVSGGAKGGAEEASVQGEPRRRSRVRRFHRKQLLTLCSMLAAVIAAFASLSVLAPFFPLQAERLGLGQTTEGIIFSIYPCVIFLASPIIGKILPLLQPRDVYLAGITITGVGNILFGLVSFIDGVTLFVSISIAMRVVAALGTSCFLTVIYALVPIVFPEDVNVVTGMLETSIGMGMCIGPAIGMWLYSIGGFAAPFFGLGAIILISVVTNCFTFPDNELGIICNHGTRPVCTILSHPRTILSLLILCMTAVCTATLYPTLQPHMHKLGVSMEGVCLVYLLLAAVYSVSAPLVGLAMDRFGGLDTFMLGGLLLTTLAFILIGNSPLLPEPTSHHELYIQDVVGMALFGVSSAMCIVPTFSSMLRATSSMGEVDMGCFSVMGGLWSSFYSLGEMLGPLYAGLLAEYLSFASATTITAFLPAALAVVFGTYMCASRNTASSSSSSSSSS